jgi:hypothetical protein
LSVQPTQPQGVGDSAPVAEPEKTYCEKITRLAVQSNLLKSIYR